MKKFPPLELSSSDKQALLALTYHDGWKVLRRIMEKQVQAATVRMLDVQPDDPDRANKMDRLQADAFAKNSFCEGLFEEVNWHVQGANGEEEEESTTEEIRAFAAAAMRTGLIKQA